MTGQQGDQTPIRTGRLLRCPGGKIVYPTKRAANKQLNQQRHLRTTAVMRVYRCRLCGNFHLTSQRESAWQHRNDPPPTPPEVMQP